MSLFSYNGIFPRLGERVYVDLEDQSLPSVLLKDCMVPILKGLSIIEEQEDDGRLRWRGFEDKARMTKALLDVVATPFDNKSEDVWSMAKRVLKKVIMTKVKVRRHQSNFALQTFH